MNKKIFVLNPNSTQQVTDGLHHALEPLRINGGPEIQCLTLASGPPGVQSQTHIDQLVVALAAQAKALEREAGAYIVACFSDPGLYTLREQLKAPVLGIAESGIFHALTLGQRFGVISILDTSIARHLRYFAAMGVMDRCAADIAINMEVTELADQDKTFSKLCEVGHLLKAKHGADVIVLGCAGMALLREQLQREIGIPVVEPTQAAVASAIGRSLLGW